MQKRNPWTIGKVGEKKTKEYLLNNGYFFDKTDISSAGIDLIAFNYKKPEIKIVECKATNTNNNYYKIFYGNQRDYYSNFTNKLIKAGFDVCLELHIWRQKEKNKKWLHEIYKINPNLELTPNIKRKIGTYIKNITIKELIEYDDNVIVYDIDNNKYVVKI